MRGLALAFAVFACSGSAGKSAPVHKPPPAPQEEKVLHVMGGTNHHPHAHLHPHDPYEHHHHPHPHPHLGGPGGHHHPY